MATVNLSAVVPRWRNHQLERTGISPMAAASATLSKSIVEESPPVVQQCICFRKRSKVSCISCGYFMSSGRVLTLCTHHPNHYFLLDISTCPNCRAPVSSLKEQGF